VAWLPAGDAVRQVENGEIIMMPPTWLTCLDVAQYPSADGVLDEARERTVDMFTPEVISSGDDFVLSTPPRYARLMAEHRSDQG
jgi:hypothetical protein